MKALLGAVRDDVAILLLTGRSDGWSRRRTTFWLAENEVRYDRLFMRPDWDRRPDHRVKASIYRWEIEPYYDVRCAIEDRTEIAVVWRSLEIPVLMVKDPCLPPLLPEGHPDLDGLTGQSISLGP